MSVESLSASIAANLRKPTRIARWRGETIDGSHTILVYLVASWVVCFARVGRTGQIFGLAALLTSSTRRIAIVVLRVG